MKDDKFVYIIFEERQLSTNTDYQDDGIMLIDDSSEIMRDVDKDKLIKYLEENRPDDLKELLKVTHCKTIDELKKWGIDSILDDLSRVTCGVVYGFHYQNVDFVNSIFLNKESADKICEYYKNNHSYHNNYKVVKMRLSE